MESLFCCVFADCLRNHPCSHFLSIDCVGRHFWAAACQLLCIFQFPIQLQTSLSVAREWSSRAGKLDLKYGAYPVLATKFTAALIRLQPSASAT
jgi:hypothetical protein